MSLRRKLVYLLVAFAAFALAASFATIYGIQFRVEASIRSFQRSLDETHEVDELRVEAREQRVRIHDLVTGALPLDVEARSTLDAFLTRLEAAARYAPPQDESSPWKEVTEVCRTLRATLDECMAAAGEVPHSESYRCLEQKLEDGLLVELDSRLLEVKRALDEDRDRAVMSFSSSGTDVLTLATAIAALGAGLVVIGAALIRRWLIQPIRALHGATQQFAQGNLDYRVALNSADELGKLGDALNQMATSLVEAQAQLGRAEAMEATVTLARGVAHDFNNLLTSATGTLTLLISESKDAQEQERLQRALQACRRAGALSRKLLDFARGTHNQPQVLVLAEVVEMILGSMDEGFFQRVNVTLDLDRSVRVNVDRDRLIQVILNLMTNARDAMPEGGDLRIAVRVEEVGALSNGQLPGRFASLEVADSGHGMTPEVRDRIFEPFFTTRSQTAGHGRGLGLAIVYTAVSTAGGTIRVDTAPGCGAAFKVRLPLVCEPTIPGSVA